MASVENTSCFSDIKSVQLVSLMAVSLVVGAQWGDEGKGKVIDYLSESSDFVVRFHGGNNAGHTVINQYGKFALHLVPSGIFNLKSIAVISSGTVLDLEVLLSEIDSLKKAGISTSDRLLISPRCHVIMPYHKILDRVYEKAKGKNKIGTTGRGIGPVYADKVSYNGIRVGDVMQKKVFTEKLKTQLLVKNKIITSLGEKPLSAHVIEKEFSILRRKLKPYVTESYTLLQKALQNNKNILLEGAQGIFLDNDWGTYPFVTASTTLSGNVTAGAGIAPRNLTDIIGVVKAYTTRVGEGPMPTELVNPVGEKLRNEGGEFGATTGRPRRCGWFDAELVRFAREINGFTEVALTKLDVLDSFKEIKLCIGYVYKGKPVKYVDGDSLFLAKVKPVYKTMKGWSTPTKGIKNFDELPKEAKQYIAELEKQIGCTITYISTGQKRDEIIKRQNI